jgi:CBS domain-containing membrane protein
MSSTHGAAHPAWRAGAGKGKAQAPGVAPTALSAGAAGIPANGTGQSAGATPDVPSAADAASAAISAAASAASEMDEQLELPQVSVAVGPNEPQCGAAPRKANQSTETAAFAASAAPSAGVDTSASPAETPTVIKTSSSPVDLSDEANEVSPTPAAHPQHLHQHAAAKATSDGGGGAECDADDNLVLPLVSIAATVDESGGAAEADIADRPSPAAEVVPSHQAAVSPLVVAHPAAAAAETAAAQSAAGVGPRSPGEEEVGSTPSAVLLAEFPEDGSPVAMAAASPWRRRLRAALHGPGSGAGHSMTVDHNLLPDATLLVMTPDAHDSPPADARGEEVEGPPSAPSQGETLSPGPADAPDRKPPAADPARVFCRDVGAALAAYGRKWRGHAGGRRMARATCREVGWSFLGALLGMLSVAGLLLNYAHVLGRSTVLLTGSFGATAVLVYAAPTAPMAQPLNVVGGHMLSAVVGVSVQKLIVALGGCAECEETIAPALAVALAIALMQVTGTLHPPGGATSLIAVVGGHYVYELGFWFVLTPVGVGAVTLVLVALLVNNLAATRAYPVYWR